MLSAWSLDPLDRRKRYLIYKSESDVSDDPATLTRKPRSARLPQFRGAQHHFQGAEPVMHVTIQSSVSVSLVSCVDRV